mgnify:FL=1
MVDQHTFPQHGDEPDAANFSQMVGTTKTIGYIVQGLTFNSVDYDNLELVVGDGVAVVKRDSMDTASENIDPTQTRRETGHVVEIPSKQKDLTDNTLNHVFVDANPGISSTPQIVVNTTGDDPSSASLKIGQVHPGDELYSERWFYSLPDGTYSFPNRDAMNDADARYGFEDGALVVNRSGPTVYKYLDGKWYQVLDTDQFDIPAETRQSLLDIAMEVGRHSAELGLNRLGFSDGSYEVYATNQQVASTDLTTNYGLESNGAGYVELSSGTAGSITSTEIEVSSAPDEVVLVDDTENLDSTNNIEYVLEDSAGNSLNIPREDIDTVIETGVFETARVQLKANFTRDTTGDPAPRLYSWGLYLQEGNFGFVFEDFRVTQGVRVE